MTFRTLTSGSVLLKASSSSLAFTSLAIKEDGILEYRSKGSLRGSSNQNEVILDTEVAVNDGSWHTITLKVSQNNVLNLILDEVKVGFEIEFSAVHDFMEAGLEAVTIGGAKFRGCVANFTLNNELQSLFGKQKQRQLLEANDLSGLSEVVRGCDVEILRVAQPQTALDVGVTIAIGFFVTLLFIMAMAYIFFKTRGRFLKNGGQNKPPLYAEAANNLGIQNQSFDLQETVHDGSQSVNHHRMIPMTSTSKKPDIIEAEVMNNQRSQANISPFDNNLGAEHYDIENASSIAPSDIDIVYHYKGYREGHHHNSR